MCLICSHCIFSGLASVTQYFVRKMVSALFSHGYYTHVYLAQVYLGYCIELFLQFS